MIKVQLSVLVHPRKAVVRRPCGCNIKGCGKGWKRPESPTELRTVFSLPSIQCKEEELRKMSGLRPLSIVFSSFFGGCWCTSELLDVAAEIAAPSLSPSVCLVRFTDASIINLHKAFLRCFRHLTHNRVGGRRHLLTAGRYTSCLSFFCFLLVGKFQRLDTEKVFE